MSETIVDLINKANSILAFSNDESTVKVAEEIAEDLKDLAIKLQGREALKRDLEGARDYSNYFEREANRLGDTVERLTAQLQSANARAEAAEKQLEASSIYHEGTAAQIEQLQTVVQEYEVDLAARDLEIEQLQEQNTRLQKFCDEFVYYEDNPNEHKLMAEKVSELQEQLNKLVSVVSECDEYLKPNPKNYIGCGSILHQKLVDAIPPTDLVPGGAV